MFNLVLVRLWPYDPLGFHTTSALIPDIQQNQNEQDCADAIHPHKHAINIGGSSFKFSYSVQSIGAAKAVSLAIGHNPGWVTTPTQDTCKLALILPTSEG